jgi:hypothetical protein
MVTIDEIKEYLIGLTQGRNMDERDKSVIVNPSCYPRALMLEANTNRPTFSSNPWAVTEWIDLGSKRSIRLPVVSTIIRTVDWR